MIAVPLAFALTGCDAENDFSEDRTAEYDEEFAAEESEPDFALPYEGAGSFSIQSAIEAASNFFVPVGTLDRADCSTIAGWVKDGDTTAPTWASIRTAPFPNGVQIAVPLANLYRPGLPFADKNHGFSIATPAWLKDGVTRTIYAHGINVDTNGAWDVNANSPLLNLSGKQLCCGNGCFGGPDIDDGGHGGPPSGP
ncbi:MAG: hypothetical protein K0V04_07420 [Deltaproteobacteria bacterium]|nr:hypothetical protein [Deltaproteobacteria bacterium]